MGPEAGPGGTLRLLRDAQGGRGEGIASFALRRAKLFWWHLLDIRRRRFARQFDSVALKKILQWSPLGPMGLQVVLHAQPKEGGTQILCVVKPHRCWLQCLGGRVEVRGQELPPEVCMVHHP